LLIQLWRIQKKITTKTNYGQELELGVIWAQRCALKFKYQKIKKSIFSIDKAYFAQLIILDKLVIGQGL